ncbi:MAG: hypothetical protein R3268_08270 [Acidiferrobacterales bacterium]|nr:hypothetical protein [Acidiferrobacterales bacterium]
MKLVGLFLIGWFIVGLLAALAVGRFIRGAESLGEPAVPARVERQRPERRIQLRRAQDRGGKTRWDPKTPDRRQGIGRRTDDRGRV